VTLALPAAPTPAPRRQVLVGTALACVAGTMLVGGMLATYVLFRERAVSAGQRFPGDAVIPEVASNVMLITIASLCVFAQWAVYAAKRQDRLNVGLALGVVALFGLAFINAQAFVYVRMELPIMEGAYSTLFYSITGLMIALAAVGLVFTAIAAFRFLGGRAGDHEVVVANALYWYFLTVAFAAVWFVIYVTK
jgi:heme/copper-type cytochrome/quinol oxidase subunit 3